MDSGTALPAWSEPHAAGSSFPGGSAAGPGSVPSAKHTAATHQTNTDCDPARRRTPEAALRFCAHPTIRRVLTLPATIQKGGLEPRQGVLRKRLELCRRIDAVDFGGVQAEDLGLVLLGELGIAELLAQLVSDLEALEGFDDPLRRTPPQAIRSPDDVVHAVGFDVATD